ncbi:hypothetical protein ACFL59_09810 [Planctomycetota bacterium]
MKQLPSSAVCALLTVLLFPTAASAADHAFYQPWTEDYFIYAITWLGFAMVISSGIVGWRTA